MKIREFSPADLAQLEKLLKTQPFYTTPQNFESPEYISRFAAENGTGKGVAFGFCRTIGEALLCIDREWGNPGWRWEAIKEVHNAAVRDAVAKGMTRAVTWVPRELGERWGERLESLGWAPQDRQGYALEIN